MSKEIPERIHVVMANYGTQGHGWGPAAIGPGLRAATALPLVYAGNSERAIAHLCAWAEALNRETGIETRVCVFEQRSDLAVFAAPAQHSGRAAN